MMIYSSVSQEVTVLPLCFLIIAAMDRLIHDQRPFAGKYAALVVAALVICISARRLLQVCSSWCCIRD